MSDALAAIVPAAGRSTRMGRPKLVLGLGDESVIQRVVRSLIQGGAEPVLVVAPPLREVGSIVLANHARVEGALVVHCDRPTPDMRATVELGLGALRETIAPPAGVLLSPGDSPGITADLVRQVVKRFQADPSRIVVPFHAGRRGHPLALPWDLALEIGGLPPGTGVNELLRAAPDRVTPLEVADAGAIHDLDTPEDYRRWTAGAPSGGPAPSGE